MADSTSEEHTPTGQERLDMLRRLREEWVAGGSNPDLFDEYHQYQVRAAEADIAREARDTRRKTGSKGQ